jgi:hypothetical protein
VIIDQIMPKTPNVRSFGLHYFPTTVSALGRALQGSEAYAPALAGFHLNMTTDYRCGVVLDPSLQEPFGRALRVYRNLTDLGVDISWSGSQLLEIIEGSLHFASIRGIGFGCFAQEVPDALPLFTSFATKSQIEKLTILTNSSKFLEPVAPATSSTAFKRLEIMFDGSLTDHST